MSTKDEFVWVEGDEGVPIPAKELYSSSSSGNVRVYQDVVSMRVLPTRALPGSPLSPPLVQSLFKFPTNLVELKGGTDRACNFVLWKRFKQGKYHSKLCSIILSTRPPPVDGLDPAVSERGDAANADGASLTSKTQPSVTTSLVEMERSQNLVYQRVMATMDAGGGREYVVVQSTDQLSAHGEILATIQAVLHSNHARADDIETNVKLGVEILDLLAHTTVAVTPPRSRSYTRQGIRIELDLCGSSLAVARAVLKTFMIDLSRVATMALVDEDVRQESIDDTFAFDILYGVPSHMTMTDTGNLEVSKFKYLTRGRNEHFKDYPTSAAYDSLLEKMASLGITKDIIEGVKKVLEAILCLGQVDFTSAEVEEKEDAERSSPPEKPRRKKKEKKFVVKPLPWSISYMRHAATLLGLAEEVLMQALCATPGEGASALSNAKRESYCNRDGLARELYRKMTKTIEREVNEILLGSVSQRYADNKECVELVLLNACASVRDQKRPMNLWDVSMLWLDNKLTCRLNAQLVLNEISALGEEGVRDDTWDEIQYRLIDVDNLDILLSDKKVGLMRALDDAQVNVDTVLTTFLREVAQLHGWGGSFVYEVPGFFELLVCGSSVKCATREMLFDNKVTSARTDSLISDIVQGKVEEVSTVLTTSAINDMESTSGDSFVENFTSTMTSIFADLDACLHVSYLCAVNTFDQMNMHDMISQLQHFHFPDHYAYSCMSAAIKIARAEFMSRFGPLLSIRGEPNDENLSSLIAALEASLNKKDFILSINVGAINVCYSEFMSSVLDEYYENARLRSATLIQVRARMIIAKTRAQVLRQALRDLRDSLATVRADLAEVGKDERRALAEKLVLTLRRAKKVLSDYKELSLVQKMQDDIVAVNKVEDELAAFHENQRANALTLDVFKEHATAIALRESMSRFPLFNKDKYLAPFTDVFESLAAANEIICPLRDALRVADAEALMQYLGSTSRAPISTAFSLQINKSMDSARKSVDQITREKGIVLKVASAFQEFHLHVAASDPAVIEIESALESLRTQLEECTSSLVKELRERSDFHRGTLLKTLLTDVLNMRTIFRGSGFMDDKAKLLATGFVHTRQDLFRRAKRISGGLRKAYDMLLGEILEEEKFVGSLMESMILTQLNKVLGDVRRGVEARKHQMNFIPIENMIASLKQLPANPEMQSIIAMVEATVVCNRAVIEHRFAIPVLVTDKLVSPISDGTKSTPTATKEGEDPSSSEDGFMSPWLAKYEKWQAEAEKYIPARTLHAFQLGMGKIQKPVLQSPPMPANLSKELHSFANKVSEGLLKIRDFSRQQFVQDLIFLSCEKGVVCRSSKTLQLSVHEPNHVLIDRCLEIIGSIPDVDRDAVLVERATLLGLAREYVAREQWMSIADLSSHRFGLQNSDDTEVIASVAPSTIISDVESVYALMWKELQLILSRSKCEIHLANMRKAALDHGLSFTGLNPVSLTVAPFETLNKAVEETMAVCEEPWIDQDVLVFLRHCQKLAVMRQNLARVSTLKHAHDTLPELEASIAESGLGDEYRVEVDFMINVIDHKMAMNALDNFIFKSNITEAIIIHEKGEIELKVEVLKVPAFRIALKQATAVYYRSGHGDILFPAYFHSLIELSSILVVVFDNLIQGNWLTAYDTLQSIQDTDVRATIPSICPILDSFGDQILDATVVTSTRLYFAEEGVEHVVMGVLNPLSVERAIKDLGSLVSRHEGHDTGVEIVTQHVSAAEFMLRIYRHSAAGEWLQLMQECTEELEKPKGVGSGSTAFARTALSHFQLEARNRLLAQEIIDLVLQERIVTSTGIIDPETVSTKALALKLDGYISKLDLLKGDKVLLVALTQLAKCVLSVRKNMQTQNWFSCASNLNALSKANKNFSDVLCGEILHEHDLRQSVLRRGSTISGGSDSFNPLRGSIMVGSQESSGKQKQWGSILNTGEGSILNVSILSTAGGNGSDDDEGDNLTDAYEEKRQKIPPEYMLFITELSEEFMIVRNAYELNKCSADILKVINRNGIVAETVGSVDLKLTRVDDLKKVLDTFSRLKEEVAIVPNELKSLARIAKCTYDIRNAFIEGKRLTEGHIPSLLEELATGEFGKLPEAWRHELRSVQLEMENQRLVDRLCKGCSEGALKVDEDGAPLLSEVSVDPLMNIARHKLTVVPRSEEAFRLIATAEALTRLRSQLVGEIDFSEVLDLATAMQTQIGKQLHNICKAEVDVFITVCQDVLTRTELEESLRSGFVAGEPGNISGAAISIQNLVKAIRRTQMKGVSFSSKISQHCYFIVESMKSIRSDLIDAHKKIGGINVNANWKEISVLAAKVDAIRQDYAHKNLAIFAICGYELDFIMAEAHVFKVRRMLQESLLHIEKIYDAKNNLDVGDSVLYRKRTKLFASPKVHLNTKDLDQIMTEGGDALEESANKHLHDLLHSCRAMHIVRSLVMTQQFEEVRRLSTDEEFVHDINKYPPAVRELELAVNEAHNSYVATRLEACLRAKLPPDFKAADLARLERDVKAADAHEITDVFIARLRTIASHVLDMRRARLTKDTDAVEQHLAWLIENEKDCPPAVKDEIRITTYQHQNEVAVLCIRKALETGRASGSLEDLNTNTIETEALEKAVADAEKVDHPDNRVTNLRALGKMMLRLRKAQKVHDEATVTECLQELQKEGSIDPVIMEEVAVAHSEADNNMAISCLNKALLTFKLSPVQLLELGCNATPLILPKAPEEAARKKRVSDEILDGGQPSTVEGEEGTTDAEKNDAGKTGGEDETEESAAELKDGKEAKVATIQSVNEYVQTEELEESLIKAKELGIFTRSTRKLYTTAYFILSLRKAMAQNQWTQVRDIISHGDESSILGEHSFDPAGDVEIDSVCKILELRSNIYRLLETLKSGRGRATCSNGIVNMSTVVVSELLNCIEALERSISGLLGLTDYFVNTKPGRKGRQVVAEVSTAIDYFFEELGVPVFNLHDPLFATSVDAPTEEVHSGLRAHIKKCAGIHLSVNRNNRYHPTVHKKTSVLLIELALLLRSARLVMHVRRKIQGAALKEAGLLAEEALMHDLHYSSREEVNLYATEINRAMDRISLLEELEKVTAAGDLSGLIKNIIASKRNIHMNTDLGFVKIFADAQKTVAELVAVEEDLAAKALGFDTGVLEASIEAAQQYQLNPELLGFAKARLANLKQYDDIYMNLTAIDGGIITSRKGIKKLVEASRELYLSNHTATLAVMARSRMNRMVTLPAVVVHAIEHRDASIAMMQTVSLRHSVLVLPKIRDKFAFQNFPGFRDADDFFHNSTLSLKKSQEKMLSHSFATVPTSLTKLHPALAALAVWLFSHCMRGIETHIYSHQRYSEDLMLKLGRRCVHMRDEILAQHVKMIRGNPSSEARTRLFKSLSNCLEAFPPSESFETYLECFLMIEAENLDEDHRCALPVYCMQNMHRTIFKYGYNTIIAGAEPEVLVRGIDGIDEDENVERIEHTIDEVTTANIALVKSKSATIDEEDLRGLHANWIRRFQLATGGKSRMNMHDLEAALCGSTMDDQDKEVFLLLVTGAWPSQRRSLVRNFRSHARLFPYEGEEEFAEFRRRQEVLTAIVGPPADNQKNFSESVTNFWDLTVRRLVEQIEIPEEEVREGDGRSIDPLDAYNADIQADANVSSKSDDKSLLTISWLEYRDLITAGLNWLAQRSGEVFNKRAAQKQQDKIQKLRDQKDKHK